MNKELVEEFAGMLLEHCGIALLVLFWALVAGLALGIGFGTLFAICQLYEALMGAPM